MPVIINTNYAATVAGNNLAASNAALQKSLNRLSSGSKIVNPSDDAGGLAVSMKLSAAAKRQAAVGTNVSNAVSLLQTQDSVLAVTGKILNRISELKVLNSDITKSSSDRANYQAEFVALQTQLNASGTEKFNGVSLFGSNTLSVEVTEDGATAVDMEGTELLGTPAFPAFTDDFSGGSLGAGWTNTSAGGSATVAGGALTLNGVIGPDHAEVTTAASYDAQADGPFEVNFQIQILPAGSNLFSANFGSTLLADFSFAIPDGALYDVRIEFDGAGNASTYLGAAGSPSLGLLNTVSGLSGSEQFRLREAVPSTTNILSFSVESSSASGNVSGVSGAASLDALSLASISSAIEDVATFRAENGANQSRLGFAAELLSVNQANLEAANSRILDVDVAVESTTLARYNVLVQAGTSMLAQANQSSQMALKLLQ